ncbi:MAG: tRNA-guanine transglycosylase DpdA [Myxococcota bacterium]
MKFFLPDSSDLVDPTFDFESESRSLHRVRHRDDLYAHEVFDSPPLDGVLVSKGIVDGIASSSRYTMAQRQRLLRVGVREFFRLDEGKRGIRIEAMGDCGAFSYVNERKPPYTVEEVLDFYSLCGFDSGLSVDHVILPYQADLDCGLPGVNAPPRDWTERQQLTIELASSFLKEHRARRDRFVAIGVAQGWSPKSYAEAVVALQKQGYRRIAIGGIVPLKTHELMEVMEAVAGVRRDATQFHLLGVSRCERLVELSRFGATSFDSTSPLRQAFKDNTDNYHTHHVRRRTYTAIRVPQVEGNPKVQRAIAAGRLEFEQARKLEQRALQTLIEFDRRAATVEDCLNDLREYSNLVGLDKEFRESSYRRTLEDRPWKNCKCRVCKDLGIHVAIFRGAERNRRRGFHNIYALYERLKRERAKSC